MAAPLGPRPRRGLSQGLWLAALLAVALSGAHAARFRTSRRSEMRVVAPDRLSVAQRSCLKERWYEQRLDHFRWEAHNHTRTWRQRYFTCDDWWAKGIDRVRRGPIFFYAGNEGDVETYINATGLMWENAERFGALLLFAEHRYYGQSEPLGVKDSWARDPSYLTVEQALADYADLLYDFVRDRANHGAEHSPIIAFGGSYGGMLAAYMRLKYPHIITGAIAASAPIGAFPSVPGFDPQRFWQVVTYDASEAAGAAPNCVQNVRAAFRAVASLGAARQGRTTLTEAFRLCVPLMTREDSVALAYWAQGAFDALAMGNYPFATSYISGDPDGPLPPWPMRAACEHMAMVKPSQQQLLEGLREAAAVLYNATGKAPCFSLNVAGPAAGNSGPWDYQWCTEMMGQEQPYYPANGRTDMFWDQGRFDLDDIADYCKRTWGVVPRPNHCPVTYGGLDLSRASNIVLSNGEYDPWSVFGVASDLSDSVVAVHVPQGAHHLDLMFSHPDDPAGVVTARQVEITNIERWIKQAWARAGVAEEEQPGARAAADTA